MSIPSKSIFFLFVVFHPVLQALAQESLELKGKLLSESHCASCHAFPSPELLPKDVWNKKVLPQMAAYMGDQASQDSLQIWEGKDKAEVELLNSLGVYPAEPILASADFQAIIAYYAASAPEILPAQKEKGSPLVLTLFTPKKLFVEGIKSPKTTLVAINEERSELLIGDANANQLFAKDARDELYTLPQAASPLVHFINRAPQVYDFISIGSVAPSDLAQGGLYEMDLNSGTWNQLQDKLSRPVDGLWVDLEKDGESDLLLCNFGHHGGNISIFPDGNFQSSPVILGGAGARKVEVGDLNGDGRLDILVLFAQGDERISVFYNLGNGKFDVEKILLRFPPVIGSSYFELKDLTGDGHPDLLVSNGDNWDYSSVNKPYHGFRIYENLGGGKFEERWFYPQYGAAKAMTLDFDQDGDLDIATIAFYDELAYPSQQFLLFENQGNGDFVPYYIAEAAQGKWLTMDVGDLDGDGDQDIVLGAYTHNFREYSQLIIRGVSEIPSVLILENDRVKRH